MGRARPDLDRQLALEEDFLTAVRRPRSARRGGELRPPAGVVERRLEMQRHVQVPFEPEHAPQDDARRAAFPALADGHEIGHQLVAM